MGHCRTVVVQGNHEIILQVISSSPGSVWPDQKVDIQERKQMGIGRKEQQQQRRCARVDRQQDRSAWVKNGI